MEYGSLETSAWGYGKSLLKRGPHVRKEHNGENSYPYLKCVNDHIEVVNSGNKYSPDAGYILTYLI